MQDIPQITDSEWMIMKEVWKNPPTTSGEIIKKLEDSVDWKPTTIKTLISRLVKKGVLGCNKSGSRYSYYPILSEEECKRHENKSFLTKIYGGSVKPLLLNFIKSEELSQSDIDELKSILDDMSK